MTLPRLTSGHIIAMVQQRCVVVLGPPGLSSPPPPGASFDAVGQYLNCVVFEAPRDCWARGRVIGNAILETLPFPFQPTPGWEA